MWRYVDLVWTDVSQERIASIFSAEKSTSEEPEWAGGCSLQDYNKSTRRHNKKTEFFIVTAVKTSNPI
jgi:hypothetical protein